MSADSLKKISMGTMKNSIGITIHKTVKPSVIPPQAASATVISGNAMKISRINAIIPKSETLPNPMTAVVRAGSKR